MTTENIAPSSTNDTVRASTVIKRKVTNYDKSIHAKWIEDYIQHLKEYEHLPALQQAQDREGECLHVIPPMGSTEKETPYIAFREDAVYSLREYLRDTSSSNESLIQYVDSADVMKLNANYRVKGGWVQLMSQYNSQLFATVAFRERHSHAAVIEAGRMLIRRLNRAIWGKEKEGKPGNFLNGYAVLEPHKKRKGHVGFLHVHFVFDFNDAVPSAEFLQAILEKEIKKIRWPTPLKASRRRSPMIARGSVDVRPVTGRRGLAMYLSKCLAAGRSDTAANIMFIDQAGMTGVFSKARNGSGF